MAGISFNI